MMTKILIACRHFPVLYGLEVLSREALGKDITIDFATSHQKIIERTQKKQYDLLIADVLQIGMSSFLMIKIVTRANPNMRILIVSTLATDVLVSRYFKAGVSGYMRSTDSVTEFQKAIKEIMMGKRYFSGYCTSQLNVQTKNILPGNPFELLSKQELNVTLLLLEGKYIKQVAAYLSLSVSAVSTYRHRIFKKLGINNLIDLYKLADQYNFHVPE